MPTGRAAAEAGDGSVTVRVVHEVNANGDWDSVLEPGWEGVEVTLTDDNGLSVSGKTGADGTVTLSPGAALTGGKYRVQAKNPDAKLYAPAFASAEGLNGAPNKLSSAEEFVDLSGGKDVEYTTAFWNPSDYCQKNAPLAMCVQHNGNHASHDSIKTYPYDARGSQSSGGTAHAQGDETGTALWGLGYDRTRKSLYSANYARARSAFGPGGPNTVYVTDMMTNTTKQFATVPSGGPGTEGKKPPASDVGRSSLGDIDTSEDDSELYVVSMADKTLYTYDLTKPAGSAPKAAVPIPAPDCPGGENDWRPGALGVHNGVVYVGGVCSGETSGKPDDMRAVIRTYDAQAQTFGDIVMNDPLNFARGAANSGVGKECGGRRWHPWADKGGQYVSYTETGTKKCNAQYVYPQPIMLDIIEESDGDLAVAFHDRYTGVENSVQSGGDINRACKNEDGKFVLDGNGACENHEDLQDFAKQDDDVREYYPADYGLKNHQEAALGGMALSRVENELAASLYDPLNTAGNSGVRFFDREKGTDSGGLLVTTMFGKAGGIGDLEVLCDLAPLQVGNRLWYDEDKDGIQDPGEKPVAGATVNLYDADGNKIATGKTNDRGEYYFDSTLLKNVPADKWKTGKDYKVAVDNPDDYAAGGPLDGWDVTQNDAGGNNHIDSDGKVPAGGKYPEIPFTTGGPGRNNHTYDFGFNRDTPEVITGKAKVVKKDADTGKVLPGAGFQLWKESNGTDGLQTDGDKPDTKSGAACTTDDDGACAWDELPLGEYYVQETKAPEGYQMPDNPVTGPFTLSVANREYEATVSDKPEEPTTPPEPPKPGIDIEKMDRETGSDADSADQAVQGSEVKDQVVDMTITNNGDEPLVNVKVGDSVTAGPGSVKDLHCDFPDGTSGDDPAGRSVRWEASWSDKDPAKLAVGASFKCTTTVTGVPAGKLHTDNSTVSGKGAGSGKPVDDEDPWNWKVPTGMISVVKKDAKTEEELAGAQFQLWMESNGTDGLQTDGAEPDTKSGGVCTTDGEGACDWEDLAPGEYSIVETKAPEGYQLPDNPVTGPFTVNAESREFSATAYDEPKPPVTETPNPLIDIEKMDRETGSDADSADQAVQGSEVKDQVIDMTIKNTGVEPLVKVVVGDSVTAGPGSVKDLHCDFPDGTSGDDPAGRSVRWEASWSDKDPAKFAVGASFKCTTTVTGVPAGVLHTDNSTVAGVGSDSGKPVDDEDPWNWKVPTGMISVVKKDAKTEEELAGAQFQLWMESNGTEGLQTDGDEPDTKSGDVCTTDGEGACDWEDLAPGEYSIVETKAPEGYQLPDNPVTGPFTVNAESREFSATAYDEPKPPVTETPNPKVDIEKADRETGSDADTQAQAVKGKKLGDQLIDLTIANNGTEPLSNITVDDAFTSGPGKVKDLACTFPDGSKGKGKDGRKSEVRWEASWAKENPSMLAVGASFKCTLMVSGVPAGVMHSDAATVTGIGMTSKKPVDDEDPWNWEVPKPPKPPKPAPKYGVQVVKKDARTGKVLRGAVFELWKDTDGKKGLKRSGKKHDTRVAVGCATNGKGRCSWSKLAGGTYYLVETDVPEGYKKPRKTVHGPIAVNSKHQKVTVKVTNQPADLKKGHKK
ncbi:SpaA isopeptide-forming pilin-related protein [Streptomyces sp. NPDC051684]|uniref:SpaA isopeptide-forming pilin-related protein n=1 Tax=Streptomyces sp. NPDC051684 TaxID=3365670 RepID=UPI0037AA56B0